MYGIVKQCEGHIDVESAPGRGTTVRVYLPMARAESGGRRRSAPTAGARGIILLVEDEEPVRLFAKAALEEQGYRVLEARPRMGGADAPLRVRRRRSTS